MRADAADSTRETGTRIGANGISIETIRAAGGGNGRVDAAECSRGEGRRAVTQSRLVCAYGTLSLIGHPVLEAPGSTRKDGATAVAGNVVRPQKDKRGVWSAGRNRSRNTEPVVSIKADGRGSIRGEGAYQRRPVSGGALGRVRTDGCRPRSRARIVVRSLELEDEGGVCRGGTEPQQGSGGGEEAGCRMQDAVF